jgi:DNA-binding NarL/FixJ family response regulator
VPVRVVIADDNVLAREGIAALLHEAGVDVLAKAASVDELHRAVDEHEPDAAVIDGGA